MNREIRCVCLFVSVSVSVSDLFVAAVDGVWRAQQIDQNMNLPFCRSGRDSGEGEIA